MTTVEVEAEKLAPSVVGRDGDFFRRGRQDAARRCGGCGGAKNVREASTVPSGRDREARASTCAAVAARRRREPRVPLPAIVVMIPSTPTRRIRPVTRSEK